jgi:2-iminoacetate synthase
VESVLRKDKISTEDLLVLLSGPALDYLEPMAQKAAAITRRHFGNVISLFTPLYISNYCTNRCAYCSFAREHSINRKQLTFDEVEKEADAISRSGIRHILVLTGEAPGMATFDYVKECLGIIARHFSAIGIEVYPLAEEEYGELIISGYVDSLTLYQETYNEKLYQKYHQGGPKADYFYRLETIERACRQRIRAVTIGALLGLDDFRREAFAIALHALYLQKNFPDVEISLSFPRICPLVENFTPKISITDRQLVQLVTAFRIMFPTLGITITTRESARFRNNIIPLGITKVSAGVSTAVGGHIGEPSTTQFEIADHRSVSEMQRDLLAIGFQPVMHDWNMKMSMC